MEEIDISTPLPNGFTKSFGGPGAGGHGAGGGWEIEFGMDLGADPGTPVYAAFSGVVRKMFLGRLNLHEAPIYGAQIHVASDSGNVLAFYTHVENLSPDIQVGKPVYLGQRIGDVSVVTNSSPHLHLAIAELVKGAETGVNLNSFFVSTANTGLLTPVRFYGDGKPLVRNPYQDTQEMEKREQPRHLAPLRAGLHPAGIARLRAGVPNSVMRQALQSPMLRRAVAGLDRPVPAPAPGAAERPAASEPRDRPRSGQ